MRGTVGNISIEEFVVVPEVPALKEVGVMLVVKLFVNELLLNVIPDDEVEPLSGEETAPLADVPDCAPR